MPLNGKQRRKLRAMGHHLSPVVMIGHQGVTEAVIAAADQALFDHELIKVKIGECPQDRDEVAEALSRATESEVAQILGKTLLLYKAREEKPTIKLD